jgi:hypothetical protein
MLHCVKGEQMKAQRHISREGVYEARPSLSVKNFPRLLLTHMPVLKRPFSTPTPASKTIIL